MCRREYIRTDETLQGTAAIPLNSNFIHSQNFAYRLSVIFFSLFHFKVASKRLYTGLTISAGPSIGSQSVFALKFELSAETATAYILADGLVLDEKGSLKQFTTGFTISPDEAATDVMRGAMKGVKGDPLGSSYEICGDSSVTH